MGWRVTVLAALLFTSVLARPSKLDGGHHDHHHHDDEDVQIETADDLVINPDGSYSYRYELTDGTFAYVNSDANGVQTGGYGYKTKDGEDIITEFTASAETGFQPKGSHLNDIPQPYTAEDPPAAAGDSEDYYDEDPDRSYKFGFETEGYSREEEADASGNVIGRYSYVDSEGRQRSLSYKAGAGIGFVPEDDNLLDDDMRGAFNSFGQKMDQDASASVASPLSIISPPPSSGSGGEGGYPAAALIDPPKFYAPPPKDVPTLYAPPEIAQASAPAPVEANPPSPPPTGGMMQMDASYSFGYESADSSREETADPSGNVRGKYSYVNNEGRNIVVEYSAGADKGFVIENEEELGKTVQEATDSAVASAVTLDIRQQQVEEDVRGYEAGVNIHFTPGDVDQDTWILSKKYAYGYSAGNDLSRSEVSDEDGAVTGTYTIPDVNGQPILVKYRAGANTGFVIENLAEVLERSVPTGPVAPVQAADQPETVPAAVALSVKPYSQPDAVPAIIQPKPVEPYSQPPSPVVQQQSTFEEDYDSDADRSYQFSYGSQEEGLREEEADSKGNVKGKYSYVNAEGNTILVEYSAGPGKGFVIENEEDLGRIVEKATLDGAASAAKHRTNAHANAKTQAIQDQAEAVPAAIALPVKPYSQRDAVPAIVQPKPVKPYSQPPSPVVQQQSTFEEDYDSDADRSYQFSYGSQEEGLREEESDSEGNVKGKYSYVNAEGNTILVEYSAGPGKGFVIENEEDLGRIVEKATLDGAAAAASSQSSSRRVVVKKGRKRPSIAHPLPVTANFAPVAQPLPLALPVPTTLYAAPPPPKPLPAPPSLYQPPSLEAAASQSAPVVATNEVDEEEPQAEPITDAAYSFKVDTEDSSHEESSDDNGERIGSYSYTNPEGKLVEVRYSAGRNGFVILNPDEVLPQAVV